MPMRVRPRPIGVLGVSRTQRLSCLQNCACAGYCTPRVLGQIERRIEERVHGVAHDLVHHAAMIDNEASNRIHIAVEQRHQCFRVIFSVRAVKPSMSVKSAGDDARLPSKANFSGIFDDAANHFRG